jgi:hypothetical protein
MFSNFKINFEVFLLQADDVMVILYKNYSRYKITLRTEVKTFTMGSMLVMYFWTNGTDFQIPLIFAFTIKFYNMKQ